MTSMQFIPRRDKTDSEMDLFDEELPGDHCCTISKGLWDIEKKHVRYNVLMVYYLVGLIHVEQWKFFFLLEQVWL